MRAQYLFDFAHLCHIDPVKLGALRLRDFAQLILHIDAYHEAKKKERSQGG